MGEQSDKDAGLCDKGMSTQATGIDGKMSEGLTIIRTKEITQDIFDVVIRDPVVINALTALDICPEDHGDLFDILDSDNSGGMFFVELLHGLEKLRGEPRRSDIVCVDLMLRSIQQVTNQ